MPFLLFEHIKEQELVFSQLEELSRFHDPYAKTDFKGYQCLLMRRLLLLSNQLYAEQKYMQEEGLFPVDKVSYQLAVVNHCAFALEGCNTVSVLRENLHVVKELLYKSWAISLELMCGRIYPTYEKISAGGKKGQEAAYGSEHSKLLQRDQWQQWIDLECEEYPERSFENIKQLVAKKHPDVSIHQLKRYTSDPRKNLGQYLPLPKS